MISCSDFSPPAFGITYEVSFINSRNDELEAF